MATRLHGAGTALEYVVTLNWGSDVPARPFEILRAGYEVASNDGKETQVLDSKGKLKALRRQDRRQHRSDFRLAK